MNKFDVIKLLSEKNRFDIFMKLLEYDELCILELEELLGLKQANTSKHMLKFKELKVVQMRRVKNMIKYSISNDFMTENADLIKFLFL